MTLRINGRREGLDGENTHFRLSNSPRILTRAEVVAMIESGILPGYHIYERNGVKYPRDNPDKNPSDNIDQQPLI